MQYNCSVCQKIVEGDMVVYMDHTQDHIIDLVKRDHPQWVEANGICKPCYEYYKAEIEGSIFKDTECALRIRKVKKVVKGISNFFNRRKA